MNRLYVMEHEFRGYKWIQYTSHPQFFCVDWPASNRSVRWWAETSVFKADQIQSAAPGQESWQEINNPEPCLEKICGVHHDFLQGWGLRVMYSLLLIVFSKASTIVNRRMVLWPFLLPMNWCGPWEWGGGPCLARPPHLAQCCRFFTSWPLVTFPSCPVQPVHQPHWLFFFCYLFYVVNTYIIL